MKDCGSGKCSEHGAHRWALGVLIVAGLGLCASSAANHQRVSGAREEIGAQRLAVEEKLAAIGSDIAVAKEIAKTNREMLTEVRTQLRRQWGNPARAKP
jgi:hypothetical protein